MGLEDLFLDIVRDLNLDETITDEGHEANIISYSDGNDVLAIYDSFIQGHRQFNLASFSRNQTTVLLTEYVNRGRNPQYLLFVDIPEGEYNSIMERLHELAKKDHCGLTASLLYPALERRRPDSHTEDGTIAIIHELIVLPSPIDINSLTPQIKDLVSYMLDMQYDRSPR